MKGFITEDNWREVDQVFPQVRQFYNTLSKKPYTFLELLELYHSFDDSDLNSISSVPLLGEQGPLKRLRRVGRIFLISVIVLLSLAYSNQISQAQVGVIPETPVAPVEEPEPPQATFVLSGADCDINEAEASLLRTPGIIEVDVEKIPGSLVVAYDSSKLNSQQMINTIGKRMEGTDAIGKRMGGKKGMNRNCSAQLSEGPGNPGNGNGNNGNGN